jgi:hypothetical protein
MSAEKYVVASVKNIEDTLAKRGLRLPTKCYTPLPSDYRPELETSAELKSDGVQAYPEMIGVLPWAVELGRVDILLEVALNVDSAYGHAEGGTPSATLSHILVYESTPKTKDCV